ncbi:MAG: FAD-binding domain [Stellaceae bacterium]
MAAMANQTVLISGAGIAGPTLAYWLAEYGFAPTLIERAPRLRAGGYVIDFWGLGYDVAEKMGLVPALEREGYGVEELRLVDAQNRRVGGFNADVFRKLTQGRYVSLARSALAELLFRTVENRAETMFGDGIAGLAETAGGVEVTFERAPPRRFDLVIGADGLHSAVRALGFGADARFEHYLGYVAAGFEAFGYRPRDENAYVSFARPGRQIARFAMREDRTMFLLVFAAATPPALAPHDVAGQKRLLQDQFRDAGWECPAILAALDRADDLYFDRVSQIRLAPWSRGRIALVGDAASCPSLLAGQGAALAMTASYVLAGELAATEGRFDPAFTRYEAVLRPFIMGKLKAAERFAGAFAPKTRRGLLIRNYVTRAMALPFMAEWTLGSSLLDRLDLPRYVSRR